MVTVTSRCKKNLCQVQHSTVKYRFSFRTLSDRNMKMDCHAIYFLQILNLVPRGYISLERTHSFHEILGDSPENLRKLSIYEKFYETSLGMIDETLLGGNTVIRFGILPLRSFPLKIRNP